LKCSNGIRFLLAQLHVDSLASAAALSVRHVRRKLQTLLTTLIATYEEAMKRIQSQEPEYSSIALKVLAWVTYVFRPLSLKELQHALAVEPGEVDLDDEMVMEAHTITTLCAGLVIVDTATDKVSLVHYTTKHYFENNRNVYFPGFHATITMSCAAYLAMPALQNFTIWELAREMPLACYAAQYMGEHARQNPEEKLTMPILEIIYELLSHADKRKPLLSLLDGLDLIKSGYYSSNEPPSEHDQTGARANAMNDIDMGGISEEQDQEGVVNEQEQQQTRQERERQEQLQQANLSISTLQMEKLKLEQLHALLQNVRLKNQLQVEKI
jgi:hypothetical protein